MRKFESASTGNDLTTLPFNAVYNFRPAIIQPIPGLQNTLSFYKHLGWMIPIIRAIAPNYVVKLRDVGTAMIQAALKGYTKTILEVSDIVKLAKQ